MIRFERDVLDDMKPAFLDWLRNEWCTCKEDLGDEYDGCECYGRNEWDNLDAVIINDHGTVACHYSYNATDSVDGFPCRQHRFVISPARVDLEPDDPYRTPCSDGYVFPRGETFICVGDFCWEGDDVDYFAPVLHYFICLLKLDDNSHMLGGPHDE